MENQTLGNNVARTVLFSLCILKHCMLISIFPNLRRVLFLPHKKTIVYKAISNSGLTPTYKFKIKEERINFKNKVKLFLPKIRPSVSLCHQIYTRSQAIPAHWFLDH